MDKSYEHFTKAEQFYVGKRREAGDSNKEIARALNRHPSSVGREINRNKDPITGLYSGIVAFEKSKARQEDAQRKENKIETLSDKSYYTMLEELGKRSSPEQIAKIITGEIGESISHQAIYNHIKKDKSEGGKLYLHLRRKGRRYRYCKKACKVVVSNKKSIEIRPLKLLLLQTFGNWEIDRAPQALNNAALAA